MNSLMGFEFSTAIFNTSPSITVFPLNETLLPVSPFVITTFSSVSYLVAKCSSYYHPGTRRGKAILSQATLASSTESCTQAKSTSVVQVKEKSEAAIAEGYTMEQFCDKMIDFFLNEKTKTKEWRKYLVFREEWNKYKDHFYDRCKRREEMESDPTIRGKFLSLRRKMNKIDDEMQRHSELLQEVQDNVTDINVVVVRRRKDFTGEFFRYLSLLSDTYDSLEDRDAVSRLGARCLTAVSAFDNTLEIVDTLDTAQAKFDDILNSASIQVACEKIKSFAKAKRLDSSLILLINSAWAKAKESTTMTDEVKGVMYRIYKATKSSLRSIVPKEIKLLKHLLNIIDPEERFSALATAFSPGDDREEKDYSLYTTPEELHKWVKIMLDAYHLNKEETDIREAKQMPPPIVIDRLYILKKTIEEEYLERKTDPKSKSENDTTPDELGFDI